jgi:hypothetical protein
VTNPNRVADVFVFIHHVPELELAAIHRLIYLNVDIPDEVWIFRAHVPAKQGPL